MAEIEQLIRLEVDRASQQRSIRAVQELEGVFDRTARRIVTLDNVTEAWSQELDSIARARGIDQLVREFPKLEKEIGDSSAALDLLLRKLTQVGATDTEIRNVARGLTEVGSGRREPGFLGRAGREIRALPAIPLGGNLSTDAIGKVLFSADAAVGALGISLSSVLAPLAAVTAAAILYVKSTESQSAAIGRLAASQEEYFRILRDGTTDTALQSLRDAQSRVAEIRAQIAELENVQAGQFAASQEQILGDLGARIRTAATQIFDSNEEAVANRLAQLNAQLPESEGLIERLTKALEENAFAAADTAKIIENSNNLIEDANRRASELYAQSGEAAVQAAVQFESLVRNGTVAGVQEQIAAVEDEIKAREQQNSLYRTLVDSGLNQYTQALDQNAAQLDTAQSKLLGLNNALEILSKAEIDAANAQDVLDTNEELVKVQAELADLGRERADAEQELADKIAQINIDAQAQYDQTLQDGVDRQLDIIEDAQDREADIRKKFGRENANAIAERDAKAAYLADQNAKDELEANDAALSKQIKREQEALDKRLKQITDNANKSILAEQRRYDREDQVRQRAIDEAIVDEINFRRGIDAITTNSAVTVRNNVTSIFGYMTQIGSAVQNYWSLVAQNVAASINSLPTQTGGDGSGDGGGGRLADPTRASAERLMRSVARDEINATLRQARTGV